MSIIEQPLDDNTLTEGQLKSISEAFKWMDDGYIRDDKIMRDIIDGLYEIIESANRIAIASKDQTKINGDFIDEMLNLLKKVRDNVAKTRKFNASPISIDSEELWDKLCDTDKKITNIWNTQYTKKPIDLIKLCEETKNEYEITYNYWIEHFVKHSFDRHYGMFTLVNYVMDQVLEDITDMKELKVDDPNYQSPYAKFGNKKRDKKKK